MKYQNKLKWKRWVKTETDTYPIADRMLNYKEDSSQS